MMEWSFSSNMERSVGEIAAVDYRVGQVFKNYGINFYCGGKKSLAIACSELNIDLKEIEQEISTIQNQPQGLYHNYNDWTLTLLIDYILEVHHKFSNNRHATIQSILALQAPVYPALQRVATIWNEIGTELNLHYKKEEYVLFPYIKNMEKFLSGELKKFPLTHVSTVKSPVRMMEQEHELMSLMMNEIALLTDNFNAANNQALHPLYMRLSEFNDNLQHHFHLENNILFPKAVILEEKLTPFK